MGLTVKLVMEIIRKGTPVEIRSLGPDGITKKVMSMDDPGVPDLLVTSTHVEEIEGRDTLVIGV